MEDVRKVEAIAKCNMSVKKEAKGKFGSYAK
jgi:hypothetical protein